MISDFINLDRSLNEPMYSQIYLELKKAIENGNINADEKIPSVRKLSADLEVSKTTVETAYNLLCAEGYVINKPQKGFFVEKGLYIEKSEASHKADNQSEKPVYEYDFSGKGIDSECSNIREWRKYVKDILNREYLLNTYSENQGEEELRKAIAKYAFTTRGVNTTPERIIIGSGTQTLLAILCGLLGKGKKVAIEKNTFPQAEQVFRVMNYKVMYTEADSKGITPESLDRIMPDVLFLNPNHNRTNGVGLSATRKVLLINGAKKNKCLIVEDDYNGELRYNTHSMMSMQSMSDGEHVYIGSFSKILLPSVRISYMVLPPKLTEEYKKNRENYNQTTSKIEQLALAEYIKAGKLEKHLRKSRRYYKTKSERMRECLSRYFDDFTLNETSMYFELRTNISIEELKSNGIKPMTTSADGALRLNFSQISIEKAEKAIEIIASLK